jgi:hypothetical protein
MKHSHKILAAVVILIIAVVSFFLIGDSVMSGMIRNKLEEKPISSARITSKSVDASLLRGRIVLNEVELIDTTGRGQIFIPEITIRGFKLWRLLVRNEIVLKSVEVLRPVIEMTLTNDSVSSDEKPAGKNAQAFELGHVKLVDAQIRILQKEAETTGTIFSTRLDLDFRDLGTVTPQEQYSYESVSCSQLRLVLREGRYLFSGGLYAVEYDQLDFDSEKRLLGGAQIQLLSEDGKYEIGRKRGVETDWFDIAVPELSLSGIRLDAVLNDTAIVLSKAQIAGLNVKSFRDKRLPFPEKPDTKLLQAMLNDLPVAVHVDSVSVDDGTISYAERVEDSTAEGEVVFTQVQAQLLCLSTIDSLIGQKTTMHVEALAMERGQLMADFVFPNKKFPEAYQASGTLGEMNIEAFNPMLVQNAAVRVETGNLNRLAFNFIYDNDRSTGDLLFEYDDLKVHILNEEDRTNKKVQSFFTNFLVLQKENIRDDRSFREGTISFERDKKKSLFNYWWKSLLSGIKSIAIL